MKKKYLLTTSEDKKVIIAEVPISHTHNSNEYVVSRDMVIANIKNGNFIEKTNEVNWDGRLWVYAEDC